MSTAVIVIVGLGILCGVLLALAARFFAVHEDPRIEEATSLLPGINCGGCGYAGCSDYAKAVVHHAAPVNLCKPGGPDTLAGLSRFMGVEASIRERHVAIVLCQGDNTRARSRGVYNGVADCRAAEVAGGASKACRYGCLGLGSCARACPVGAIEITPGQLAVVHPERCIGCERCVATCPRHLIFMVPESRHIHVLCRSRDRGPAVKRVCSVGCVGCSLCAKTVGNQGIVMDGHLAAVDYGVALENEDVMARCPQHCFVDRSGRIPMAGAANGKQARAT